MADLLVLLETDGSHVLESSLPAIRFAQDLAAAWGAEFDLLVAGGPEIAVGLEPWLGYGARTMWCAALPDLSHPTADRLAAVCGLAMEASGAGSLVGAASATGKDVLPRAAELRDLAMVSDVVALGGDPNGHQFVRPMYAGNIVATVEIADRAAVFSVRLSAFRAPEAREPNTELRSLEIDTASLPVGTEWVSTDAPERRRPELTAARVVVSGGRPLRDAETFERLLGCLADALGGAVGATRAAVDSGIAPNELQVGQTGKIVAPDLYIAAGVSGSVQHLAGMKDSRVIVAINTDPEAPIFSVADYGLVEDLHTAVPELTQAIRSSRG